MKKHSKHILRVLATVFLVLAVTFASLVPGSAARNPSASDEIVGVQDQLVPAVHYGQAGLGGLSNPTEWKHFAFVKRYAHAYGIDFRVILSIIRVESEFNHEAVSARGARGLMQIMPVTNAEVAGQLELDSISLPEENLRGGIFYFSKLCDLFPGAALNDRFCLALAAYNAGPSRVYDAQELTAFFGENPHSWKSLRQFLPLLSKRYASLHRLVWKDGRPPSGYFGSGKQAVRYVQEVMSAYRNVKSRV